MFQVFLDWLHQTLATLQSIAGALVWLVCSSFTGITCFAIFVVLLCGSLILLYTMKEVDDEK